MRIILLWILIFDILRVNTYQLNYGWFRKQNKQKPLRSFVKQPLALFGIGTKARPRPQKTYFRPSPIIHENSQVHFTNPIKNPADLPTIYYPEKPLQPPRKHLPDFDSFEVKQAGSSTNNKEFHNFVIHHKRHIAPEQGRDLDLFPKLPENQAYNFKSNIDSIANNFKYEIGSKRPQSGHSSYHQSDHNPISYHEHDPHHQEYNPPSYHDPQYNPPSYHEYNPANYHEPELNPISYHEPEFNPPSYHEPEYTHPSYHEPEYNPPSYHEHGHDPISYHEPEYNPPSYHEPEHNPPSYHEPEYSPPSYLEPEYNPPSYHEPQYNPPSYHAPEYKPPHLPASIAHASPFIPSSEKDGCTTEDGRFVKGGDTWALPKCRLGICAKALKGGWQVATESCDSVVNNPQYSCAVFPSPSIAYPDCCPKPLQCQ